MQVVSRDVRIAESKTAAESSYLTPLLAVLFVALPAALCSQEGQLVQDVAGCYSLHWEPWMVGTHAADSAWQTVSIENRVWLTLTPINRRGTNDWFVVRTAPGAVASEFGDVRWSRNDSDGSVLIEWDATMSGVRLELERPHQDQGLVDSLAGSANQWSRDSEVPETLRSRVRAVRQACTRQD